MHLKTWFETLADLALAEKRQVDTQRLELVFFTKDSPQWLERLEKTFGPAFKPGNAAPSGEAKKIAEAFGGIRKNQTLFCLKEPEALTIALLWPWEDGERITLKVFAQPPENES